MKAFLKKTFKSRYFWMELLMLCSITYFIAIVSDVEYSFYEENNGWFFLKDLSYRMCFGTFHFILYGTYYWVFLRRFVNRRKPLFVFISVIIFVPVIHYYNHYVATWAAMHMPFLSDELRSMAARQYAAEGKFNVIYAYMLSTRCMPIIFFAYLIRSLKQEAQLKTLKEQQLMSELNYLKAQVQPHFFFNTLNNIYALAIRQSADTAPVVLQLSEMMRYILYQSAQHKVHLQQEIDFLHNYVEIERIRHQRYIRISFDVEGDTGRGRIEPLLLLPFVENAFKHGAHETTEAGYVEVVICIINNELSLLVKNSKPCIKEARNECGIGLTNVRKRLELLYPAAHQLQIADNDQEYEVNLSVQLI
jgi:hypothetical protein